MTRKWFLSLLGIGAAGQTTGGRKPDEWVEIRTNVSTPDRKLQISRDNNDASNEWLFRRPLPNQCPVCGTMAEPYKGEPVTYVIKCTHGLSPTCTFEPVYIASDPRIVRCAHCNAAFWQDSEGAK